MYSTFESSICRCIQPLNPTCEDVFIIGVLHMQMYSTVEPFMCECIQPLSPAFPDVGSGPQRINLTGAVHIPVPSVVLLIITTLSLLVIRPQQGLMSCCTFHYLSWCTECRNARHDHCITSWLIANRANDGRCAGRIVDRMDTCTQTPLQSYWFPLT